MEGLGNQSSPFSIFPLVSGLAHYKGSPDSTSPPLVLGEIRTASQKCD